MNKALGTLLLLCLLTVGGGEVIHVEAGKGRNSKLIVSGLLGVGFGLSLACCLFKLRRELDEKRERILRLLGAGCAIGVTLSALYFCYVLFQESSLSEKEEKIKKFKNFKTKLFKKYVDRHELFTVLRSDANAFVRKIVNEIDHFVEQDASFGLEDKVALQNEFINEFKNKSSINIIDQQNIEYTVGLLTDSGWDDRVKLAEQKKREEQERLKRKEEERLRREEQERLEREGRVKREVQNEIRKNKADDELIIRVSRMANREDREELFKDIKDLKKLALFRRLVKILRGGGGDVKNKMVGALEVVKNQLGVPERVDKIIDGCVAN
jgi:hypothetical protein